MIATYLLPLLDMSQAQDLADNVTALQWGILAIVVLVLVFALFKKLVKTAVFFAIVAGVIGLAIYGNTQGWFS